MAGAKALRSNLKAGGTSAFFFAPQQRNFLFLEPKPHRVPILQLQLFILARNPPKLYPLATGEFEKQRGVVVQSGGGK